MGSREREPSKRNSNVEAPLRPEFTSPPTVILASESQRRKIAARYLFPNANLISIPGGEEPQSHDLVLIANKKLDHAMPQAINMIMQSPEQRGILIGTDVKVYTLGKHDQEIGVKDRGKPKDDLEVRQIFQEMYVASTVSEQDPYYIIRSACAVADLSTNKSYRKKYPSDFTGVLLNADRIGYLSTKDGFAEYKKELEEFFSGQSYLNNGLKMPANIIDITGGIDLPVLARMGAVKALSFNEGYVYTKEEVFAAKLKQAIFSSGVGFNPAMLKPYEPEIHNKIENWPWLQSITDYALRNASQA